MTPPGLILVHLATMKLANKQIVVAVSGSIAAYKSAALVRELQKAGAQVRVAMTLCATRFITPLTLQALSGYAVHLHDHDLLDHAGMDHIALSRWADAIIVAPATANIIARLAHAGADDFVTSLCLAHENRLAIAPAMNQAMWNNAGTQENIARLIERGVSVFGPTAGTQACGESGAGRMLEVAELTGACISLFSHQALLAKKVLITAGPTLEALDPVRFISNRSSGKMGYALAAAAAEAGAHVKLVSGPTALEKNHRIDCIEVESAQQMLEQVMAQLSEADLFIACAAVADYQAKNVHTHKVKKTDQAVSIELTPTVDILTTVKARKPALFCVGFAAETENLLDNAAIKLATKGADMIVANQVGVKTQGFDSDFNAVEILYRQNQTVKTVPIARARKTQLADQIISLIAKQLTRRQRSNVTYFKTNKT